jgi:hypothetical protein
VEVLLAQGAELAGEAGEVAQGDGHGVGFGGGGRGSRGLARQHQLGQQTLDAAAELAERGLVQRRHQLLLAPGARLGQVLHELRLAPAVADLEGAQRGHQHVQVADAPGAPPHLAQLLHELALVAVGLGHQGVEQGLDAAHGGAQAMHALRNRLGGQPVEQAEKPLEQERSALRVDRHTRAPDCTA